MKDLAQLQLLAQLVDSMDIATDKLGKSYEKKDSEGFFNSKNTILEFQKEVSKQLK